MNPVTKLLFMMILKRAFHPVYHDELDSYALNNVNHNAYTALGKKITTGWMTITGNPDTSVFNTTGNAFCSYLALRLNRNIAQNNLFALLGLYGGDDSLNRPEVASHLTEAANMLGLTLEKNTKPANAHVTFLGRVFLDPWSRPHSICDVRKALARFHLSPLSTKPAGKHAVLRRKAEAWLVTDPNTPVLSAICRRMIEHLDELTAEEKKLHTCRA